MKVSIALTGLIRQSSCLPLAQPPQYYTFPFTSSHFRGLKQIIYTPIDIMKSVQFYKQERKIEHVSIQLKGCKRELERLMSLKALQSKKCSPKERSLRKRFNGAFDANSPRWGPSEPTNRLNTENMGGQQKDSNFYSSQMRDLFGHRYITSRTLHAEQRFKADFQFKEEDEPILEGLPALREGNFSIKEEQKGGKKEPGNRKNGSDCSPCYRQSEYSKRIRLHPRLNITTKEDLRADNNSKGSIFEIMEQIRQQMRKLQSDNNKKTLICLQLEKMNSNEAARVGKINAKLNVLKTQHQWDPNEKNQSGVLEIAQTHQLLKAQCKTATNNTEQSYKELREKCEAKDAHIRILLSQIKRVVSQDVNLKQRLKSAEKKIRLKDQFIYKIIASGNYSSNIMHQHIQKCNGIQETRFGAFDFKKKSGYPIQAPRGNLR